MVEQKQKQCEELRKALADARAQLEPPAKDSTLVGVTVENIDPGDTTPDASPEVLSAIRNIEQALREAGCEH